MKLGKFIAGLTIAVFTFNAQAQEEGPEKECLRMRFLAGEELKIQNYKGAASYYLKGEKICGGYDKDNYARLIGCLKNTISTETDDKSKVAYVDTLLGVYQRASDAKLLDPSENLAWASYILQTPQPDRVKADSLFSEGIKSTGKATNEAYVTYYYYNMYMMWFDEKDATKKDELKKRLIVEYFSLSKLIGDGGMSTMTQENVTNYFNSVVGTCADILPSLNSFMKSLPQEKEAKMSTLNNFLKLLESKECTSSKEYVMIVDTLIKTDPTSIDVRLAKIKLLSSQGKYSDANTLIREVRDLTDSTELKAELDYYIVLNLFRSGSYTAAYKAAMNISGKYKGEALKIAAQSVAATANSCGETTIERKANYIYADELMDRARAAGVSGSSYKANYPSTQELFNAGKEIGQSQSLDCWGVTVTFK